MEVKKEKQASTISENQRFVIVASSKSPEPENFHATIKETVLHKSHCATCFVLN